MSKERSKRMKKDVVVEPPVAKTREEPKVIQPDADEADSDSDSGEENAEMEEAEKPEKVVRSRSVEEVNIKISNFYPIWSLNSSQKICQ